VTCQLAFDGLKYPNGLALGSDSQGNRQLYAASSGGEGISVFAINPDDTLRRVDRVPVRSFSIFPLNFSPLSL
jgi:hypothetical protein